MGDCEWADHLVNDEFWTHNPNSIKQLMKEHQAKDEFPTSTLTIWNDT